MSATPPDHSTGRGASGRHRGTSLPLTLSGRSLPWRTVGLRSAAGLALVVGAGVVTLGPARLPDGVATPAAAHIGVADAAEMDAAALSMRLSDRASRSGRAELLPTGAFGPEAPAHPQTRINPAAAVPVPAPPPAPAAAPAPAPTATATPKPTATPSPKAARGAPLGSHRPPVPPVPPSRPA